MATKKAFNIFGVILILVLVVRLILMFNTNTFSLVETLAWFSLAYICFAAGYLHSQFDQNDERAKHIKQKAFQYSLIAIMPFLLILTFVTQTEILTIAMLDFLAIFTAYSFFVIFTTWIIVAKRN